VRLLVSLKISYVMHCYSTRYGSKDIGTKFPLLFVGKAFDMLYEDAGNVASMTVAKRHDEWH
jgi:hypothetical protein